MENELDQKRRSAPPLPIEAKEQQDQFIVTGTGNTITINHDSSAVKTIEALMAAQRRKDDMSTEMMAMTKIVMEVVTKAIADVATKRAANPQPAPSAPKKRKPAKKVIIKKKGKK